MGFLGATLKDAITNVVAFIMVVLAAVQGYLGTLGGEEINWYTLAITVVGAIVAYLTGKSSDAKPKKVS